MHKISCGFMSFRLMSFLSHFVALGFIQMERSMIKFSLFVKTNQYDRKNENELTSNA